MLGSSHRRRRGAEHLSVNPLFAQGSVMAPIPARRLPDGEMSSAAAYQIIHDELMLDGNARQNLATFVTTWMEPEVGLLMAECLPKNMIDKDEYPQTAEMEHRCVSMLADLWNAPDPSKAPGCSTVGSSEACMLGGLALKRRWQQRRKAAGKSTDKPNIVMGINVQVCWDKFANYFEVEPRLVPMAGDRFHLTGEEAVKLVDENTIGVVAVLGSTFDGSYEPVAEIAAALDRLQERTGLDVPIHVDGASGGDDRAVPGPGSAWDFRIPRVASINTSGHKYGLVFPGVGLGPLARRGGAARGARVPRQLPGRRHADLRPQLLAAGRPDRGPVLHVPAPRPGGLSAGPFRLPRRRLWHRREAGRAGPVRADHGRQPAARGGVPRQGGDRQLHRLRRLAAATRARLAGARLHVPGHREDLAVLRIVVRNGFSHDLAGLFLADLERLLPELEHQAEPIDKALATSFRH